jgi:hypothetical protein
MPLDLRFLELRQHVLVAGYTPGAEMVEEQAHRHPALGRVDHGREHRLGHLVPGGDVELDVDEVLGIRDRLGHRRDRLLVVLEQLDVVVRLQGKCTQSVVEPSHRDDVRRLLAVVRERGGVPGRLQDSVVRFLLSDISLLLEPGPSEHGERDQPEQRTQQHRQ